MKTYPETSFIANTGFSRKEFIASSLKIAVITGVSGIGLLASCKDDDDDKKVSPPEDLMQEHGLLNRILLVYDHCRLQLTSGNKIPVEVLTGAAGIIRTFVEEYHEKQEEDYLFPRFQKAGQHTDLVSILLKQHKAGRVITGQILQLCKSGNFTDAENHNLINLLASFNTMYRPHEAREDTVLFPAFRKIVSQHEYDSLGEEFEDNEHKKFGKDGFETMVAKVASIEQKLGIYDLDAFTPKV